MKKPTRTKAKKKIRRGSAAPVAPRAQRRAKRSPPRRKRAPKVRGVTGAKRKAKSRRSPAKRGSRTPTKPKKRSRSTTSRRKNRKLSRREVLFRKRSRAAKRAWAKRKGKPVKLSSDGNRHFKQLSKRGMISPKAAAASGIKGATK